MVWWKMSNPERRRSHRIKPDGLTTAFGDVVDLSRSGLCLFRKGEPGCEVGDELTLELCHEEAMFVIHAKVVRHQSIGFRRHEIGLEFTDRASQIEPMLERLVRPAEIEEQVGPQAWLAV